MTEVQGKIALLLREWHDIPALPTLKAGSREANFTSSNQVFNAEGSQTSPGFPSQTATPQKWLENGLGTYSQSF